MGQHAFNPPGHPGTSASEIFSPEQLLGRCLGKIEFVQRVLDVFLLRIDADVGELQSAWQQQDAASIARVAHRIKGSAASVAAPRLQALMAEIESLSRGEGPADASRWLPLVHAEAQALKETMASYQAITHVEAHPREKPPTGVARQAGGG